MVLGRPANRFAQASHVRNDAQLASFLPIHIRLLHQVLQVVELEGTHAIDLDIRRLHRPVLATKDCITHFYRFLGYILQAALVLSYAEAQIRRAIAHSSPANRAITTRCDLTCQLTLCPIFVHSVLLDLLFEQSVIIDVPQLLEADLFVAFVLQLLDHCLQSHVLFLLLLVQQAAHLALLSIIQIRIHSCYID